MRDMQLLREKQVIYKKMESQSFLQPAPGWLEQGLPGSRHTSYLSFLLHWQDFRKPNFTPKKTTKGTKNTKNVSEKVKYMHFFHSIWKNLHLTENFYTDTVCGVCDKYEVCCIVYQVSRFSVSAQLLSNYCTCTIFKISMEEMRDDQGRHSSLASR